MERWRPILGVEQIIISVLSMIADPNDSSPANIDAAVSSGICCVECIYIYVGLNIHW